MAVVQVSSTSVANAVALPRIFNSPNVYRGKLRESQDVVTVTNGDSIASVYRLCRVKSSDRLRSLLLLISANITSGAANVGLYLPNGGVPPVTPNFTGTAANAMFAAAQTIATASLTGINITFAVTTIANMNKRIWELLGFTSDPGVEYEIALTLTAAAAATGQVGMVAALLSGD